MTASRHQKQPCCEQDQWKESGTSRGAFAGWAPAEWGSLCIFPSAGLSPCRSRSRMSSQHHCRQGRKKKADPGKRKLICQLFSIAIKMQFVLRPNASWQWCGIFRLRKLWPQAVKRLGLSVSSVMFCAYTNSIQPPFPDERKGSAVVSDQYFILDQRRAPEGTFPVWCGEIQYRALHHVSEMHTSRECST